MAQVAGILGGDPVLIGQALDGDVIVEPARGPLIPGFAQVKAAARAAGNPCPMLYLLAYAYLLDDHHLLLCLEQQIG